MSVPIHLPHQQPSRIAVSTTMTTPNSLMTSTQVLSLQTLPAACPTCSTHFSQPFAHYSIIMPLSSPKPIYPLTLLSLPGSPLKSSVLSLTAAIWNAPISPHTLFFYLNPLDARSRYTGGTVYQRNRQKMVYSEARLSTPQARGQYTGGTALNAPGWKPVYRFCFLMHTGTTMLESYRYRQDSS